MLSVGFANGSAHYQLEYPILGEARLYCGHLRPWLAAAEIRKNTTLSRTQATSRKWRPADTRRPSS
jgi:hypothetical protein